jgi:ABC-type oligopeptide transport system substrate-binding subunit
MITRRFVVSAFVLVLVAVAASTPACKKDEPKSIRWNDAAAAAAAAPAADADAAAPLTAAGTLNKFFPKDGEGGYTRVFAADKEGYAEAKLQKDGKEVAVLSISDAERLTSAKAKFDAATDKLEGFPLMTVGKNQSTVLVKNRFQVKVSSQTLDPEARKAILAMFDLKGLGT